MTIKEKLKLMDETKAVNDARTKEFVEGTKAMKHWNIDYAVICDDGMYLESSFVVEALDISNALDMASDILSKVAHQENLKKWAIWNIGIVEDKVF